MTMRPASPRRGRYMLIGAVILAVVAVGVMLAVVNGILVPQNERTPAPAPTTASPTVTEVPTPTPSPTEPPSPAERFDIDDPASLTVVVNKQRPLIPADWSPTELVHPAGIDSPNGQPLRPEAAAALEAMHAAAQEHGIRLVLYSGYRSFDLQTRLFATYSAQSGVEAAETFSARPSHSEHQTGLAADLGDGSGCSMQECFENTTAGQWLRENAYRFGFILRYDRGEQATVGYIYEPWHFRFIGVEIAGEMHEQGITNLEDYFGLPAAPGYD